MKIITPLAPTTMKETKPGDLIYFSNGPGRGLAIVLRQFDWNTALAVLTPEEGAPDPYLWRVEHDNDCLRLKSEWVLELLDDKETLVRDPAFRVSSGAIHVDSRGVWLHVEPRPTDRSTAVNVNLESFEVGTIEQAAAAFPAWRIWAAQEDRHSPRGEPLFSFKAKAKR